MKAKKIKRAWRGSGIKACRETDILYKRTHLRPRYSRTEIAQKSQRKKVKKVKKELDKRGGAWYHVQAVAREQRQTKPRGTVYLVN